MLKLNILFYQTKQTIPLSLPATSQATEIVTLLSGSIFFPLMPTLIYRGRVIQMHTTLAFQHIPDGAEIILYQKKSDVISNTYDDYLDESTLQVTPLNQKIFSILNEVHRLEDLYMDRITSNEEELLVELDDDESTGYNDDDDDDDSNNEGNNSDSDNENYVDGDNEVVSMKEVTVLGPDPDGVSADPLPNVFVGPNWNNAGTSTGYEKKDFIVCPEFTSIEEAGQFFMKNSFNDWNW